MDDEESRARSHPAYRKARAKAEEYVNDPEKLRGLADRARRKANDLAEGPLRGVWDDLQTALQMVTAYVRGEYRRVPYQSLLLIAASLLYLLAPIDLIPDFLLGVGFVDDASLIAWTLRQIHGDLEAFREWRRQQQAELPE